VRAGVQRGDLTHEKTMTEAARERSDNTRIAVGIIIDEETLPLLSKTVASARTLSDHIFVLAVGKNVDVNEPGVTVYHGGWAHDEASTRNMLIDYVEEANAAEFLLWLNPGEEFDAKTLDEFQHFLENDSHRDFLYMIVASALSGRPCAARFRRRDD